MCAIKRHITKSTKIFFASSPKDSDDKTDNTDTINLPEEPSHCCMSGCDNCVWIQYAEELNKIFKDGGEKARKKILEKVSDPSMRAFLLSELFFLEKNNNKNCK